MPFLTVLPVSMPPRKPLPRRVLKIIGLLTIAAALQACSAVKLAYNQAPELAYWYLDGYVDLSSAQTLQVKESLARLHTWHRQTQLPAYADLLQKLQQQMPGEIAAPEACTVFAEIRRKLTVTVSHTEPDLAALASTLSPAQLLHLERKFAKGDAEYKNDFIDPTAKALRSKRYKQALGRAETLYGRLNDAQKTLIGERIDQSRFDASTAFAERQRRQQDTLQSLRKLQTALPAAQAVPVISSLLERAQNSPSPGYRAYVEDITQDSCAAFAEFHATATAAQRQHAAGVVGAYAKDMRVLAGL